MVATKIAIVLAPLVIAASCSGADPPSRLPQSAPTLSACDALAAPSRKRVRVRGRWGGFTSESRSKTFSISSDGLCNGRAAATVWVNLWHASEREKADDFHSADRRRGTSADLVTVEGTVAAGLEGRSIELQQALIVND
jgi:transcriptional regulator GlxA family with amidase domain